MSQKKKNSLFLQGTILACAGIITKIIGFVYRIPMANMLGNEGNGIYSVAFGIYNIALTLSSYSLPLAVSKLVSYRTAKNEHKNVKRVFVDSLVFAVIVGSIACLVLYAGADFLESLYQRPGLAKPLRVLAPTTFVVALLGVLRGFFQGHGNMLPTAVSQVGEQIVNAFVSVIATYQFMRIYAGSPDAAAYGAAGGTVGTLLGAITALVLLVFMYFMMSGKLLEGDEEREECSVESHGTIARELILTVLPIILSQTIYQIGYTIDDFLFGNLMLENGFSESVISSLQGVFNTQYNQLINLPVAVATAMAASTLPAIVRAGVRGGRGELNAKIDSVVKFNMAIAVPSAFGLTVLGGPIVRMLFPRLTEYQETAQMLLLTGSMAVIFYALSTITTSILQGQNYMRIPVIHSAISLGIHVCIVFALLKFTDLGVYGLVIANVIFPVIVSLLNMRSISHKLDHSWNLKEIFFMPLAASVVMAALAWGIYKVIYAIISSNVIALLISIVMAVAIYGFIILKIKCFSREELQDMPGGSKLARLADKF